MERKIIRLLLVGIAVLLEVSFIAPLMPNLRGSYLVMLLVISWTVISGFERVWLWVVLLGLLMDFFSLSVVGVHVILFTLVSYSVSFVSRRFLIANKGWGMLTMVCLVVVAAVFYDLGNSIAVWATSGDSIFFLMAEEMRLWGIKLALMAVLFLIVYSVVDKLERYLSFYDRKINISIK